MNKITIEGQIQQTKDGQYDLVVTTTHMGCVWTSKPARLTATDWEAAYDEASFRLKIFAKAILP